MARALAFAERHALLLLLALAAALRLPWLAAAPPDIDETFSWWFARRVLESGDFWNDLGYTIDAPLFAALDVWVAQRFGLSITALRVPPALFGSLSVPLACLVVRRLRPGHLGLATGVLSALSPFLIFYSVQARPYAQLLFTCLLFALAFLATEGSPRPWRRRALLCACSVLAVGSHYYALVFLCAFYAVRGVAHLRAHRLDALRDDLASGSLVLVATLPLVALLVLGLVRLDLHHWQVSTLTLPAIFAEHFLFLGNTLGEGSDLRHLALSLLVAALVALPFPLAWRRVDAAGRELALLGVAAPALVALLELLTGIDLLFYPRGFIACVPFLLAAWLVFAAHLPGPSRLRNAYLALLLIPFAINGLAVATARPAQAFFLNRDAMHDIVRQAETFDDDFDVLVVHHWWLSWYFVYYYPKPEKIWDPGELLVARRTGEPQRVLAGLPKDARILLVLNSLATRHADPGDLVVQQLARERTLRREITCQPYPVPGDSLFCERMLLFGPARAGPR
jgi:hypothetical protein